MRYDLTFVEAIFSVLTGIAIVLVDVHGGDLAVALLGNLVSFVLRRFILVKDYRRGFFSIIVFSFFVEMTSF